jgi:hypothetical protein
MDKEEASGIDIGGIVQRISQGLSEWSQDQPRAETLEDLAAIAPPRETIDAIRAVGGQLRAVQATILEGHGLRLRDREHALEQVLNERQRRLQAYDERVREETLTGVEGKFVVAGRIVDESGTGLPDVRVSAFDLDRKYDDLLGETRTNMMGYYRLEYDESDFEDLPDETPETYIEVLDEEGEQLYTSAKSFFYKADEVEVIDASVDASTLPRIQALGEIVSRAIEDQIANLEDRKQVLDSRTSLRSVDIPQDSQD